MIFSKKQSIYLVIKRATDILLSFLLIVVFFLPIIVISFLVLATSGTPIFFNQERIGKNEKIFRLHKFRTMINDAEKLGVYSSDRDFRLTKFGRFLRKTSLDELPQLFNVFVGEMSFIGPRPPLIYHPKRLEEYTKYQKQIFKVRPGMTGWAQVNGRRTVEWNKRFDLNVWYVKHISFCLDFKIFFKTIFSVLSHRNNENVGSTTERSHLNLMYITNDKRIIRVISKIGVDYIFIDMEYIGKEERQKGLNTVKNHHCISDIIVAVKNNKGSSRILVRVNPMNPESEFEINSAIQAGADVLMLPMFKEKKEVSHFIDIVNGRAKVCLLLETKEAVACLDDILMLEGIDQIHIGLNDLHLSYGLNFMFELLSNGVVPTICEKISKKNIPFGFGGISHIDGGDIPAQIIIAEHFYLNSSWAILSRGFVDSNLPIKKFKKLFMIEYKRIRDFEGSLFGKNDSFYVDNQRILFDTIKKVANKK